MIVYIALLGMLLTGGVLTSYRLLQGSTITSVKTTVQDEGNFVLRKVVWALGSASDIPTPSGTALTVTRYDGNTVDFRLSGTAVEMRESDIDTTWRPITTPNVRVESLQFVVGSGSDSVTMTVTIKTANGTDTALPFTVTKYLRK